MRVNACSALVLIGARRGATTTFLPGQTESAWNLPADVEAILFAIDGLASDGLRPADYHRHGLHEALARFRDEHRQTPDRVLGRATLSALNVPVSDRFGQMRVTSSVHAG